MAHGTDPALPWRGGEQRLSRILRALSGTQRPAVVLGASVNGLSFARSLGRRGVPTLLADIDDTIGLHTRFGATLRLRPTAGRTSAWMEMLSELGHRFPERTALLPTTDETVLLISEHGAELGRWYRFVVPDAKTTARIIDKQAQYETARVAGLDLPTTFYPDSVEAVRRVAPDIRFPCVVKPHRSDLARPVLPAKAWVVQDRNALSRLYEELLPTGLRFMVQEDVPGGDDALVGYLALWDEEGRELAYLTKRKLRQYPPGHGDGSLQVTEDLPEAAELGRRLVRALGLRGYAGVEFKRDSRDDRLRLMEINPRSVSGNQLAVAAGVDLPWIGYLHLHGRPLPEPPPLFRPGVRYVHEEWDLGAFRRLRRAGEITPRQWLRSIRGCRARALGAWDDPMPLLATTWRMARRALGRRRG